MNSLWAAIIEFFTSNVGLVFALVMLAAVALVLGAVFLYRRTGQAQKPALMVLLAAIAIGNVLIWTLPTADGSSPIEQAQEAEAD